jgi:hypothetical protein
VQPEWKIRTGAVSKTKFTVYKTKHIELTKSKKKKGFSQVCDSRLKIKAACSFRTLAYSRSTAECNNPEGQHLYI